MSTLKQRQSASPIALTRERFREASPTNIERSAQVRINQFKQELEKYQHSLARECTKLDREVKRLKGILKTLDSPLEQAARHKTNDKLNELAQVKTDRKRTIESQIKSLQARLRKEEQRCKTMLSLAPKYPFIEVRKVPWLLRKKPQIIPLHSHTGTFWIHRHEAFYCAGPYYCFDGPGCYGYHCCSWDKDDDTNSACFLTRSFLPCVSTLFKPAPESEDICYTFPGVIPQETKAAMHRAESDFENKQAKGFLLLLVDAESCQKEIVDPDPLVVGYHPHTPELLWFIAAFDMTPIEELIAGKAIKRFPRSEEGS